MAEQRVQRRLAAILAADVVGYSRLIELDEEKTRARLRGLHAELIDPQIEADGGRIVKTTGDGILVEFPSAVDAVRNALTIQSAMAIHDASLPRDRRILFRVGINLGDVIVEDDDIHGEGVNVASRLEGLCEPGEVYVSGTVRDHVEGKLAARFDDLGEHTVKNIVRPVRVYRVQSDILERQTKDGSKADDAEFLKRPALAVLPFENLSGDPEQTYFADGLTEDIITALSLWRSFPVIARNSTFVYKDKAVDVQEVGRALGARYVLEGSVRRSGDRIRVTAQLIDADTGHHVWAERLDRRIEDIFDLQDELTNKIAAIVAPELERAAHNRLRAKRPNELDAWYLVQRGTAELDEYTKEGNARAREFFSQALKRDPVYCRAYAGIALSYNRDLMLGHAGSREKATNNALEAAQQAVGLDRSDSLAQGVLGMAQIWAGQLDEARLSFQRSVELNPSHGYARASLGNILDLAGQSDEGISMMEDGLTLNPDAPNMRHIHTFLARALVSAHRYEDAVDSARKGINANPTNPNAHYLVAVGLAHMGRREEANAALGRCESLQPGFVASRAEWSPYKDAAANEHIRNGLRNAGLAE